MHIVHDFQLTARELILNVTQYMGIDSPLKVHVGNVDQGFTIDNYSYITVDWRQLEQRLETDLSYGLSVLFKRYYGPEWMSKVKKLSVQHFQKKWSLLDCLYLIHDHWMTICFEILPDRIKASLFSMVKTVSKRQKTQSDLIDLIHFAETMLDLLKSADLKQTMDDLSLFICTIRQHYLKSATLPSASMDIDHHSPALPQLDPKQLELMNGFHWILCETIQAKQSSIPESLTDLYKIVIQHIPVLPSDGRQIHSFLKQWERYHTLGLGAITRGDFLQFLNAVDHWFSLFPQTRSIQLFYDLVKQYK
jgi:hypothetical protein